MFKLSKLLSLLMLSTTAVHAQTVLFEVQAAVQENTPRHQFKVIGDKEDGSFTAYGVDIVSPDGQTQEIGDFESVLPDHSEVDALVIEDVNFDGYADLRLMEYLPGGANVPYFFWLYEPTSGKFRAAPAFQVVLSPEVDMVGHQLISRQRTSATEYVTEFYQPMGDIPVLKRQEVRVYEPDGSSKVSIFEVKGDAGPQFVESKILGPEED